MADADSRSRKVFVVHGRDKRLRREVFQFLRALDLAPVEWAEVLSMAEDPSPLIGDLLDKAMGEVQAVLVLLSPDDEVRLRPEFADGPHDPELRTTGQARPNVIFEAGMAERFRERVVYAVVGTVRPYTDIGGRFVVRLDGSAKSRSILAGQLRKAGCAVRTDDRTDWLSAGELTPVDGVPAGAFEIGGAAVRAAARGWVVEGTITGTGPDLVTVIVEATVHDDDYVLLGCARGLAAEVRAGERTAFRLVAAGELAGHAHVHVTAEAIFP